jgi:hypothetical protein
VAVDCFLALDVLEDSTGFVTGMYKTRNGWMAKTAQRKW